MSKRKLVSDGRMDEINESLKKFRVTVEQVSLIALKPLGVKRKRDDSENQILKKPTNRYGCSLHDNDVSICSIYGCSGGQIKSQSSLYNYIN